MKFKMFALAAALVLTPVAASAAMDCCKDCACCKDKKTDTPKPDAEKPAAPHAH
jgi:hypothetical protein